MKRIILYLAIFLCLSSTHAFAGKKIPDASKRFELFTHCMSIDLLVEVSTRHSSKIGLTKESIQNITESRLRSARIFSNEIRGGFLVVGVYVIGQAFTVRVEFAKRFIDPLSDELGIATTWETSATGTHGNDPGFILSSVSGFMDKFLVEFLRVNDEACRNKR